MRILGPMILLPFALVLLFWFFAAKHGGLRESLLMAATATGTLILLLTEGLSLIHALTPMAARISWSLTSIAAAAMIFRLSNRRLHAPVIPRGPLLIIAAILLITGVIAVAAPPNNFDSMTYHMARVANWMQNRSVAPYPTQIVRQLELGPWAEFAILQLQLLSGGSDRWANLVQWLAFAGSAASVSLILRELRFNIETQMLGAILLLTAPMLILQSTSTQNDLVCGFWVAAFVFFGMRGGNRWIYAALCLALALNTKATAILVAAPFALAFIISNAKSIGWRPAGRNVLLAAAILLTANAGFVFRNVAVFGHPMGDPALSRSVNMEAHDPAHVASNVLRNAALHWGTPIGRVNLATEQGINRLHEMLRLDVSDPRTTWGQFHVIPMNSHEDLAGNFLLGWLTIAAFIIAFVKHRDAPEEWSYAWKLGIGFVLFCAALKWQPWHSRLHVPYFILGSVLVAASLSLLSWPSKRIRLAMTLLFLAALPWLLFNRTRPLLAIHLRSLDSEVPAGTWRSVAKQWLPLESVLTSPRDDQMFANYPSLEREYKKAVAGALANGCGKIGMSLASNSWEYPVHSLARNIDPDVRLVHIVVNNQSSMFPADTSGVCSVLSIRAPYSTPGIYPGAPDVASFHLVAESPFIRLYARN